MAPRSPNDDSVNKGSALIVLASDAAQFGFYVFACPQCDGRPRPIASLARKARIGNDDQFECITSSGNGLQLAGARTVTVTGSLVVMARSVAETTS